MDNALLIFLMGWVVTSALGVLFAKRITVSAFSLFSFLISIAGVYALLGLHAAVVAQVLIYVGGVMVLVAFSLYLYTESSSPPRFSEVRQSMGKATLFLPLLALCYFFLPWKALEEWVLRQNPDHLPASEKSLAATGQFLALHYLPEFEWLGILMLAGLVVAGWYIREESENPIR